MGKTAMSRNFTAAVLLAAAIGGSLHSGAAAGPLEDANKKLVLDFYTMSFGDHQPRKAADLFLGDIYIQHNPRVPNGREAFSKIFEKRFKENPQASSSVKRVIAEGDLVVLHSHSKLNPQDDGSAIVDIFRVQDGKIVEHWDVVQPVPAGKTPNGNTMFDGSNTQ